jgi:four helix bundle protein
MSNYKELIFWQKAYNNSISLINLTKKLPRDLVNRVILNQLLRTMMSIGANIAEGYGRYGIKEFPRFLQISLGSANESDYWLMLLKENNLDFQHEIEVLIRENMEVSKMLSASIRTMKNKIKYSILYFINLL